MDNDWNVPYGTWKDNDPLGHRVQETIEQNTMWMLYLRKNTRFYCPEHWNTAEQSARKAETFCNLCWGFGVKVDPIIIPTRLSYYKVEVSQRHTNARTDAGYLQYVSAQGHLPRKVKPELEDFIIECEWDKPLQKVGDYPRARITKFVYFWTIKQMSTFVEREVGWSSVGLEPRVHDMHTLNKGLSMIQDIPIMSLENTWPNKRDFWS